MSQKYCIIYSVKFQYRTKRLYIIQMFLLLIFNLCDKIQKVLSEVSDMKEVTIYTDGACSGNPGAGGWGTILDYQGRRKELSGGEAETTNNRMELTAVIEGLKALKEPCRVTVVTDSQYVSNGITLGWAKSWKANNWRKKDRKPALNPELWDELLTLIDKHEVTFNWIRGHAGHPENERCDEMAVEQSRRFSQK